MNIFEFIHREMKLLHDYQDSYGEFTHDDFMEERDRLYRKLENWIEKGLTFQANADQEFYKISPPS